MADMRVSNDQSSNSYSSIEQQLDRLHDENGVKQDAKEIDDLIKQGRNDPKAAHEAATAIAEELKIGSQSSRFARKLGQVRMRSSSTGSQPDAAFVKLSFDTQKLAKETRQSFSKIELYKKDMVESGKTPDPEVVSKLEKHAQNNYKNLSKQWNTLKYEMFNKTSIMLDFDVSQLTSSKQSSFPSVDLASAVLPKVNKAFA